MPPRRSQRLAGPSTSKAPLKRQVAAPIVKRAKLAAPEEEDDDADEDNEEECDQDEDDNYGDKASRESKPRHKRAKGETPTGAGPKRHRGMRGILQKMTDTPLDVLFEVCVISFWSQIALIC